MNACDFAVEVQDLAWTLLDEQATDKQIGRLEELLLTSNEARRIYVSCIQLHVDLHDLLGSKPGQRTDCAKAPVRASVPPTLCHPAATPF
jgi:hypothetical protein